MSRTPDSMDAFVGSRIALRRAALGLSQGALAQRLGLSFQQVQKYESGANRVSASRLHQIAVALGLSVVRFFPDMPTDPGASADDGSEGLRFMAATAEGRTIADGLARIESRDVRRAVATLVEALAAR